MGITESADSAPMQADMLIGTFDESPMAISVSRLSDGCFVHVNARWCELMHMTREEVLGKDSVFVGVWADADARRKVLSQMRLAGKAPDGVPPSVTFPYRRRDGREMQLQMQGARVNLAGVDHVITYVTDVTDQHRARQALQHNQNVLERLNEDISSQMELYVLTESLARVGHWKVDAGDSRPQWSQGLYDLTGLENTGSLSFTEARSRIAPQDWPLFMAARERLDGEMVEYRWNHPDGEVRWLRSRMRRHHRADGSFVDIGVVQDYTSERKTKMALQDQLDVIQRLTSKLPVMVFQLARLDETHNRFVFVNDAVETIFGVTPEQAVADAKAVFRRVHHDDIGGVVKTMQDSARDRTPWVHEFRVQQPDGAVRFLLGKAMVAEEHSGQVVAYGSVTDLTDQRASQVSLMESESRFRALTELSSDWYWEQDAQFRFVRLDGSLVNQAGRTGNSSLGKTRWEVGALNMTAQDWEAHRSVLEAHAEFRDLELRDVDYRGRPFWMSISGAPFFDAQGQFQGYRGVGRNITARKRAEEKITRLAFFDVLTGLPNRRLLMDRLQQALAVSARDRSAGALLFIDLDNFKDLNDSQGHDVGDLLLKEVAARIETCLREVDTVARLGGDEFIVMLQSLGPDLAQAAAQAEVVAQKILAALNQTYMLRTLEHHSTPSIGITLFEDHIQTVDELLKQADLAMYESKAAGRNTLRFFDPEMQAMVAQRTELDSDLRLGLRRGELVLYYQPVVDAHRRVTGMEALVRWRHPAKGLVPPADFIPMAEQSGLILPLGDWVMETACLQLAQWARLGATSNLTMAVNVSARQFRRPDFVQRVEALLETTGAKAPLLKLELTESLLLSDVQDAVRKMTELGARGVKFSLDDFGTGYSSLTYLKMLPLEQLKIDQSFVRDVLTDANDAAIARTVLALGHSLGLSVVAEGVETAGQLEFLLQHGCTQFQGYLFGRPVPIEALQLDDPAAYI